VLNKKEEEGGLNLDEMHSNAALFMAAGTETTATELSGTLYYLMKNPEKLAILVEEIRTEFPNEEDISMEKLPQLKYLHACLEEGLRIYPPVPVGLPRVTPKEGATVLGEYIPPNVRDTLFTVQFIHSFVARTFIENIAHKVCRLESPSLNTAHTTLPPISPTLTPTIPNAGSLPLPRSITPSSPPIKRPLSNLSQWDRGIVWARTLRIMR
jgi:hypothetical protein